MRPYTPKRHTDGCLSDCVAYLLNVHPMSVPFFIEPEKGWSRRFKGYMRRRGMAGWWGPFSPQPKSHGAYLVVGRSQIRKAGGHCVVYRGSEPVYNPSTTGIKGEPTHMWILNKE